MRIWALFFVIFFVNIYGQYYTSTWYSIENGLPQSSAKSIIKDKSGFIWISTENGLVRYDGFSFITFNDFNINNVHFGDFLGSVLTDSIYSLNNYQQNKILINQRIPKLVSFKKNDRTVHQKGKKLMKKIDKIFLTLEFHPEYEHFIETKTSKYTFGQNYILYQEKGCQEVKIKIPFTNKDFYNLFLFDDRLYVINKKNRKTYIIDKGKLTIDETPTLFNDPDTKIYWQQITNQTIIINKGKIYLLETKKHKLSLKFLIQYDEIGNYPFCAIFYDQDFNKLYLGTLNNGLNIIRISSFHVAKRETDFADNVYYTSLPFTKSSIITGNGTEFSRNGVVGNHHFGNHSKYIMMYDNFGNILLKNENNITTIYKKSGYTTKDSTQIKKSIDIFSKDGNFYATSLTNISDPLLFLFKKSVNTKPDFIYHFKDFVTTFSQYSENEILVGSSGGLYSVNLKTNKITLLLENIHIKSIIKMKDHLIWITTSKNGFYLLKNNRLIKMPNDKNNYLQSAHYILEDAKGFYWISSNNGLFKVPKKQLLAYSENNRSPVFYYRFTKKDGFLTNEFNGSPGHILENGEFVFPSMNGFVFFNPDTIKTYYPEKGKIFVERVRVNNSKTIYFRNSFTLKNNYKTADIFIDIPYYSTLDNLSIEAKVLETEGAEWEPIDTVKDRKYTISNLEPGDYTLMIRVLISPDGIYEERAIKFNIESLFYQTFAFKIAFILVFIAIILIIIQLRTVFLRLKNKALKQIVHNQSSELKETSLNLQLVKNNLQKETEYQKKLIETISHDITTPIKFIAMLSQKLHESDDVKLQKKYFDSIYKSSEHLYQFTLSLKEYSDLYKSGNIVEKEGYLIYKIVEGKKNLFLEIAKEKGTSIILTSKSETLCYVNENIVASIIHNILDNAVKNTFNGTITLDITENEQRISITTSDTGTGMSAEQISGYTQLFNNPELENPALKGKGLGLYMVIHLIKKINAHITITPNYPKGTSIEITLQKPIYE